MPHRRHRTARREPACRCREHQGPAHLGQGRVGLASVRTGATLLFDSDPAAEELETRLKARALLEVLAESDAAGYARSDPRERPGSGPTAAGCASIAPDLPGTGMRVLLVDHQDSFVHTLAGYFAEQGAAVTTLRARFDP